MSDSINSITVVLEEDLNEYADVIISAIKCIKGVLSVKGNASDYDSMVAEERAKAYYAKKLMEVIFPKKGD